jgi:small ubiquitin-related modifier
MSDHEEAAPKTEPEQLNIKVKDNDGNEVFFKVKKHTKLSKLQRAYAERMGKPASSIRFLFDGTRIGEEDTAESLGMDDGDEIDAMVEQLVSILR